MTIEQAIEILEKHNLWRRGADVPMCCPTKLGIAIDLILKHLKNE